MHASLALAWVAAAATASTAVASFAPTLGPCPSEGLRLSGQPNVNQTLNQAEADYTQARKHIADDALRQWLTQSNNASAVYNGSLVDAPMPKLGIVLSGGGFRASIVGAAFVAALDGRNETSVGKGTGGLLQGATYLTGLSGGSLLLASFVLNEMPSPYQMVQGYGDNSTAGSWNLNFDLLAPGQGAQSFTYLQTLLGEVGQKRQAGFNVTLVDIFARALSYHFIPGTSPDNFFSNSSDHGASITWSSATNLTVWQNRTLPFPIFTIQTYSDNAEPNPDAFSPGITLSNTNYEISPIEFGSFDPKLAAFVPTAYLGTPLDSGRPTTANGQCVSNFDNAGFVIGCSSNIFPGGNRTGSSGFLSFDDPGSPISLLINVFNQTFGPVQPQQQLDVGAIPNPFMNVRSDAYEDSNQVQLRMVDGGFGGEGAPVSPLLVKARGLDVLVVVDSSDNANTTVPPGAPTGATLIATSVRAQLLGNDTLAIPPLPQSIETIEQQQLTSAPVFFGCNATASRLNGQATNATYPLIVYVPNYDPEGITNTSSLALTYTLEESQAMLDRALDIFYTGRDNMTTSGGGGDGQTRWSTCLACAVVERSRARVGSDRTAMCDMCFDEYCWNETEANAQGTGGGGSSGNGTSNGGGGGGDSGNGNGGGATGSVGGSGGGGSENGAGSLGAHALAILVPVVAGLFVLV